MPKSQRSIQIQYNSVVEEANALYLALMEDLRFLANQVIGQLPKNKTMPIMDLQSIGSLA